LAAQRRIAELEMAIQERDGDLQYVRQQLTNQTNRAKESAERYGKEQERLRTVSISLNKAFEYFLYLN